MKYTFLLSALCSVFGVWSAQAQSLTLVELTGIGAGHVSEEWPAAKVARVVPFAGWTYQGVLNNTHEHYWTYREPGAPATDTPEGTVSLISSPQGNDVVLKTSSGACVRRLRHELQEQKLEPVPVAGLDCTGVRYTTRNYTLSIYNKKTGPYPHVVVVRVTPQPMLVGNDLGTGRTPASPE